MGNTGVDSSQVASHCIDDGGFPITETVTVVMGKKIFQDPFHLIKHPMWPTDTKFAQYNENGSMSKAGNLLHLSSIGAGGLRGKARATDFLFNDFVFTITVKNLSNTFANDSSYAGIAIYKDDNNVIWLGKRTAGVGNDLYITLVKEVGGVVTQEQIDISDVDADTKLELTRSGDTWDARYDNDGLGWHSMTQITAAIGADCQLQLGGASNAGVLTVDFDDLLASGTGVYFDTKTDGSPIFITYNQQVLADGPGATIQYGSANFTEDSNMKYRVKEGSGAYSAVLNSAGIIALGDRISDTGTWDIEAYCEGVNAAASWTNVIIPTVSASATTSVSTGQPELQGFTLVYPPDADESTGLDSGADSVTIRDPIISDGLQVDSRVVIRKSKGGTQKGFADWPIAKIYTYQFETLTELKANELRDFLIAYVGQDISLIDYNDIRRNGVILTPIINFTIDRDVCSYSIGFEFRENTQDTDEYHIDTESELTLETEGGQPLVLEVAS